MRTKTTKTTISALVLVAAAFATLLTGSESADAARVNRTPTAGTTTRMPGQSAPNYWGYGRGWCYWHPYVCQRS
jgi:hypothetical protein